MFQNRHPANSAASSSGHHHPGGATTGGGGHQQQQQQAMKSGGGGGGGPQQGGGPVVKDLLDRVQEEFGLLQQQLHNTRVELEKSQQERESVQRFAMAYQESVFPVHMEMQKHAEIAKRLTGILTHVIPLLPQDHQHSAVTAVERAKAISPQELQTLLNQQMQQQQMAAMLSAVSPAAAAAFNPAMMMAGMGLNMNIKPEEAMQAMLSLNNIFKNPSMLGAMPPAAALPGMPSSAAAAGLGGMPGNNNAFLSLLGPGPSSSSASSSVPPGEEVGRSAMQQQQPAAGGRASSGLMNSGGGHNNSGGGGGGGRPRSGGGTPSTPNSSTSAAKRAKLEPEEGDGELEIDVQNDDASSSAAPSHHTNGRTSQPPKGGGGGGGSHERDTASASSSRDGSATPRSGKQQLSSTPCSSTGGVAGSSVPPPPHQPSSLGPLLPTPAGLANFFSTFPANLNSQMSGLFGLPPPPGAMPGGGAGGQMPPGLGTALAVTNGKSPSYAFKMSNEQALAPVNFPDDVTADPHVPKGMKRIGDLPHGDVVCAVTMARDGRRVFTGGRGAIKMWDIGGLDRGLLLGGNNSSSAGGSDNGGDNGGSPSSAAGGAGDSSDAAAAGTATSNGGGGGGGTRRAGSAEPWAPVATFPVPCLKDSYIRSCKLFPDASTLIVGGETRHICLLDVEQAEVKMTLDCEVEACYALALSADCRLCFACCSNGTVVIWDLQSGERVAQLEGHSDGASCVDLSGDGQKLWTGGLDNTVRCWDIGERAEMEKQTLESQIFSLGCCPNDDWVAVGMEDQNVQVLNTSRPGDKYLLHGHQSCVLSLKFAHNGKWFVSTGKDYVVNCWRTPYGYRLMQSKETSSVLSCDISADDRYLLTGSGDRKASLYELSF